MTLFLMKIFKNLFIIKVFIVKKNLFIIKEDKGSLLFAKVIVKKKVSLNTPSL